MDNKIVLFSSDEAAEFKTVTGWVSRNGKFFGDHEESARYDGCTHRKCNECGGYANKWHFKCKTCRDKEKDESYFNLPYEKWDRISPLFLWNSEDVFFDMDELEDFLHENNLQLSELKLMTSTPNYMPTVDLDHFGDMLPEDGDYPEELVKRLDEFNKFIQNHKPISWSMSKYRTSL